MITESPLNVPWIFTESTLKHKREKRTARAGLTTPHAAHALQASLSVFVIDGPLLLVRKNLCIEIQGVNRIKLRINARNDAWTHERMKRRKKLHMKHRWSAAFSDALEREGKRSTLWRAHYQDEGGLYLICVGDLLKLFLGVSLFVDILQGVEHSTL
jgi:hypothetical protein